MQMAIANANTNGTLVEHAEQQQSDGAHQLRVQHVCREHCAHQLQQAAVERLRCRFVCQSKYEYTRTRTFFLVKSIQCRT